MRACAIFLLAGALAGLPACEDGQPRASATGSTPATGSAPAPGPGPTGPVRLVAAGEGDVAALVLAAEAAAAGEHRRLLVYVGAVWCKPCVAFHEAAERGELDAALPGLTLLELDADRDQDRLVAAGYQSRLIPLFVVPGPDGRATDRATSGARTGSDYVAELVPRIQRLLASPPP